MALWPNCRTDLPGRQPYNLFGLAVFQETEQRIRRNLAYFAGPLSATSSVPEGAFGGPTCIIAPLIAGAMSAANNATDITFTQAGNVLAGGPVEGAASLTFSDASGLSLQVTLAGAGAATFTQTGNVALTIGLAADGTFAITGTGGLSMIVPAEGGATFAMSGSANLKGLLSMSGDITPFTELSPENLAAQVWAASIETGFDARAVLRLLSAVAAGKTDIVDLGGGLATVTFRDLTDSTARVTASMSGSERASVTLDTD